MVNPISFNAPWSRTLKWITGLSILLFGAIILIGLMVRPGDNMFWILAMIVLPLGTLMLSACFMVRGYVITAHALLVQRLGWNTRLELATLQSVVVNPRAMESSIRTFGNGGLFSFSGYFHNQQLGRYRALATDLSRAVVLRFTDQIIVITPEDPHALAKQLTSYITLGHKDV